MSACVALGLRGPDFSRPSHGEGWGLPIIEALRFPPGWQAFRFSTSHEAGKVLCAWACVTMHNTEKTKGVAL